MPEFDDNAAGMIPTVRRRVTRYIVPRLAIAVLVSGLAVQFVPNWLLKAWAIFFAMPPGFDYELVQGVPWVKYAIASSTNWRSGKTPFDPRCTGIAYVFFSAPLVFRGFRPRMILGLMGWAVILPSAANLLRLRAMWWLASLDLPYSLAHDFPGTLFGLGVGGTALCVCWSSAWRSAMNGPLIRERCPAQAHARPARIGRSVRRALAAVGLVALFAGAVTLETAARRRYQPAGLTAREQDDRPRALLLPSLKNSIGMQLVRLPAGSFVMGTPDSERAERTSPEFTPHLADVRDAFWMSVCEVSQQQYALVMAHNPSEFHGDDLPVDSVSWDDAMEFCRRLSEREGLRYRLPSEDEWEYACRAGSVTRFHWGDTISDTLGNYAAQFEYPWAQPGVFRWQTLPVGSFPCNAWGLFDMHGNVAEWCADVFDQGLSAPVALDPSQEAECERRVKRVYRGGGWYSDPVYCRSAARHGTFQFASKPWIGFRVVRAE